MNRSLKEKQWFFNRTGLDTCCGVILIDYGCGDSSLGNSWPGAYVGYDRDLSLIQLGHDRYPSLCTTHDINLAIHTIKESRELVGSYPSVLNLSSVLHEVYHEGTQDEVFANIKAIDPDTITIRDMGLRGDMKLNGAGIPVLDAIDCRGRFDLEFQKLWLQSQMHFEKHPACWGAALNCLLTALHPSESWEVEGRENYYSIPMHRMLLKLYALNYDIVSLEFYTPAWIRQALQKMYGPDVDLVLHPTHFNLMARKHDTD
jgi:hypothetical protein